MKTNSSHKNNAKQRLEKNKPLFSRFGKKKAWRTKKFSIDVTRRLSVQIKIRKFKTTAKNRSKKINQTVVWFGFFGLKEVVFIYKYRKTINRRLDKKNLLLNNFINTVSFAGLAGIIIFGSMILGVGQTDPPIVEAQTATDNRSQIVIPEPIESEFLLSSTPSHIAIPSINVDTDIQRVGLLDNGSIQTPGVLSGLVGWYQYGPTPGEKGPAVLVGHVDSYKGPSVFWNLSKLKANDILSISREDGTIVQFSVTQIVQYDQDNFNTEEVYGNIDFAGLRVITCGGTFNHITGHYSKNTVVFATMIL